MFVGLSRGEEGKCVSSSVSHSRFLAAGAGKYRAAKYKDCLLLFCVRTGGAGKYFEVQ